MPNADLNNIMERGRAIIYPEKVQAWDTFVKTIVRQKHENNKGYNEDIIGKIMKIEITDADFYDLKAKFE